MLDEATSALDADAKRLIPQTLDSWAGDVTFIVIAYLLATVRHCDQVSHLSVGRVTCRGSFEQVCALKLEYDRHVGLLGL